MYSQPNKQYFYPPNVIHNMIHNMSMKSQSFYLSVSRARDVAQYDW